MTKKIAKYKIDIIARELTRTITNIISEIGKIMSEKLSEHMKASLPKEVADFHEKYPNALRRQSSFYYRHKSQTYSKSFYLHPTEMPLALDNCQRDDVVAAYFADIKQASIAKTLFELAEEQCELEQTLYRTKNRIEQALMVLGTVPRVRDEFPEAYAILVRINND